MDHELLNQPVQLFGYSFTVVVTVWKLFGYIGVAMFAGSWFFQLHASRKAGKPVMTRWFWTCRLFGSVILLAYWVASPKGDSVGVLQNLFPFFVAGYNLYLDVRYHRTYGVRPEEEAVHSSTQNKAIREKELQQKNAEDLQVNPAKSSPVAAE